MGQQAWNVYLNGKLIDTVFCAPSDDADDVKRSLVNHDGYDSGIVVKKRRVGKSMKKKSKVAKLAAEVGALLK